MPDHFMRITSLAVLLSLVVTASAAEMPEGERRIKVLNYAGCFELWNAETRVTLCHQVGGRVLEYSFKGTNALYLDPEEAKWGTPGGPRSPDSAGRFDIGPEYLIPERDKLWDHCRNAQGIARPRPRVPLAGGQVNLRSGNFLARQSQMEKRRGLVFRCVDAFLIQNRARIRNKEIVDLLPA